MTRKAIALTIDDVSTFAKTIRASLNKAETIPNHSGMLNLIARAAGYQNFQHLSATPDLKTDPAPKSVVRALRVFDDLNRMTRWPNKTHLQGLCLWVLWQAIPKDCDLSEMDVNGIINTHHTFGDTALIRRAMLENRMIERTKDGQIYRRLETTVPQEAIIIFKALRL